MVIVRRTLKAMMRRRIHVVKATDRPDRAEWPEVERARPMERLPSHSLVQPPDEVPVIRNIDAPLDGANAPIEIDRRADGGQRLDGKIARRAQFPRELHGEISAE